MNSLESKARSTLPSEYDRLGSKGRTFNFEPLIDIWPGQIEYATCVLGRNIFGRTGLSVANQWAAARAFRRNRR